VRRYIHNFISEHILIILLFKLYVHFLRILCASDVEKPYETDVRSIAAMTEVVNCWPTVYCSLTISGSQSISGFHRASLLSVTFINQLMHSIMTVVDIKSVSQGQSIKKPNF
jgi:hypothetical protein